METKEEILSFIQKETGWTDEQCLAFYAQEEKMQSSDPQETCPIFYAYYIENEITGRRNYGAITEEEFVNKRIEDEAYDFKRCFNKIKANEWVEDQKDKIRHEKNWDRYMNT